MLMDKAGEANEKKKRSITRVIIDVLVVNTFLNLTAVLVISGLFFYQQATSIYDDLNKSIVGEASSQIDSDLIKDMANTCIGVFKGIDNPKEMFKNDPEGYYARFPRSPDRRNTSRSRTSSSTFARAPRLPRSI